MRVSGATDKFAYKLAGKSLEHLVSQLARAGARAGVEEVHDLRVAIRRFRQVLVVFKTSFPGKETKRVQRALKKTAKFAGEVRDFDIAGKLLEKSRSAEAAKLRETFLNRRQKCGRALAAKVQRLRKRRLFSRWSRELSLARSVEKTAPAQVPLGDAANRIVAPLRRRFFGMGNRAAQVTNKNLDQLHRFRIAAKKIRYTLELLIPLRPVPLRQRIEQLKELQSLLGRVNDLEIAHALISRERASKRLCTALLRRRNKQVEEFKCHWRTEFATAGTAALWKQDLRAFQAPRKPPARSLAPRTSAAAAS